MCQKVQSLSGTVGHVTNRAGVWLKIAELHYQTTEFKFMAFSTKYQHQVVMGGRNNIYIPSYLNNMSTLGKF